MGRIGSNLDLACRSRMVRSIEPQVKACEGRQGWTDVEHVLSLLMLNLVGGAEVGGPYGVSRRQCLGGF